MRYPSYLFVASFFFSTVGFADETCKASQELIGIDAQNACVSALEASCLTTPPATDAELLDIYDRAMKPMIRETKRPLTFFHYGWRTKRPAGSLKPGFWDDSVNIPSGGNSTDLSGSVSPVLTGGIKEYVDLHLRGHFEAIHQTQEQLGDGLYVAPDPVQSLDYSGNPGLLLRVRVSAGMRYVDMRKFHKSWPVTKEEAFKVNCERFRECHQENPDAASCTGLGGVFSQYYYEANKGQYYISPKYDETKRLRPVIKQIYLNNHIDALAAIWGDDVYPECKKVKAKTHSERAVLNFAFINPEASKKIQADLLVPSLEKNPSTGKREIYSDVMKYFDALDVQEVFKNASINEEVKAALDKFWLYYKSWATALYNLPANVDIGKFQKDRYAKMQSTREEFLRKMYGCSEDPAYRSEIESPGEKND